MRVLHHYQLSASARFIRLVLAERGLVFLPKIEIPWERNDPFLSLNPAGEVPVLVAEDGLVIIETMLAENDSTLFAHNISLSGISFVTGNGERITNLAINEFGEVTTNVPD